MDKVQVFLQTVNRLTGETDNFELVIPTDREKLVLTFRNQHLDLTCVSLSLDHVIVTLQRIPVDQSTVRGARK